MGNLDPLMIGDFRGGINKSTPVDNIADNELDEALNMNLHIDGSLYSRAGASQYNATLTGTDRITSIYYHKHSRGTDSDILVTTLAKIYKDNGAGDWTDITGSTAPPSDSLWMWRTFNNVAIGVNGSTVPQKHDFSTISDLGGSPPDNCHAIEVMQGRVYLMNDDDEPTALHGCAANNSGDWTTPGDAFTIFIDKDNGHRVIGAAKFFGLLIIFKRKGVYKLVNPDNDPTNMQIIQIFDDIGCVSPHTIKQVGNELIWMDDDGVYALKATQTSGDVAYSAVSKKIQPYIDSMTDAQLSNAYGVDIRELNQFRFAVPNSGSTENNHYLVRDYFHAAWLRHTGINYAVFGRVDMNDAKVTLAGGYDGKVYKVDVLHADAGAAYSKEVRSKRFHFGRPKDRKHYHRIYTEYLTNGSYSIGFTAYIDYGGDTKSLSLYDNSGRALWDDADWDVDVWGDQLSSQQDISIGKKGRNIQLRYLNIQASEQFTLYKFEFDTSLLGRRS